MIIERPLTDQNLFLKAIIDHDRFHLPVDKIRWIADMCVKDCTEFVLNGEVSGYIFLVDYEGVQSIHGYKLVDGYTAAAYRAFKRMCLKYPNAKITLTNDNKKVIRLIRMLGFRATDRYIINDKTLYVFSR